MVEINDADLIRHAQQGDVDAVGIIYNRYHETIFKFFWVRVQNKQLAEDLTGELFTRMIIHLPAYRERGAPFEAWLFRIARNLAIDHYRKQDGRLNTILNEHRVKDIINPFVLVEQNFEMERVFQAMRHLKDIEQEVIILRFVVGLSLQEVAETLDKKVGTVKTMQHRGLKALRLALHQE